MAAEPGNKYAEKWDKETTLAKLSDLLKEAKKTSVYYIGQGLANIGMYHQWYSEMADKFKDDQDVSDTIKGIDQTFEAKLVSLGLQGSVNPTMAIFTLKNKHLWKDKSEIENNGSMTLNWNEQKTYEAKP